jgi:hypothetical protein
MLELRSFQETARAADVRPPARPWSSGVVTQPGSAFVGHRQALPPCARAASERCGRSSSPSSRCYEPGAAPLVRLIRPLPFMKLPCGGIAAELGPAFQRNRIDYSPDGVIAVGWANPDGVSIDSGANHSVLCYSPRSLGPWQRYMPDRHLAFKISTNCG